MKILVGNVHSVNNAGDAVLMMSTIQQLLAVFPQAEITVAVNDASGIGEIEGVNFAGSFAYWAKKGDGVRWHWRYLIGVLIQSSLAVLFYRLSGGRFRFPVSKRWGGLVEAFFEADIFVSCAGNFLYSGGRFGMAFFLALYTMMFAVAAGKPSYTMPQTIGPVNRAWERWLLARTLSRFRLILTRDNKSLEFLKSIGIKETPVVLVEDIAFSFQGGSRENGQQLLENYDLDLIRDRPLLGVSLINWGAQDSSFKGQASYEAAVAYALAEFQKKFIAHVVFFSQVHGPTEFDDDRIPARRVYDQLKAIGHDQVRYIEKPVPPQDLKAAYSWMDLFLGTRLHANIFALTAFVPIVAIQYQPKTRGVLGTIDLDRWVVEIDTATGPELYKLLEAAWEMRGETKDYLKKRMPEVIENSLSAGQLISANYRKNYAS